MADREHTTNTTETTDITKGQFGKLSSPGASYKNMNEDSSQKQKSLRDRCILKVSHSKGDIHS